MTELRKLMKSIAKEPAGNTLQYHKDKLKLHTDAFKTSMNNEKKHSDLYRAAKKSGDTAAAEFHDSEAEKHLKDAEGHSATADQHRRIVNNGNKAGGKALAATSNADKSKIAFHKESEAFHDKMVRKHYNAHLNAQKGSIKAKHHEEMLEHHKMNAYKHRDAWMSI